MSRSNGGNSAPVGAAVVSARTLSAAGSGSGTAGGTFQLTAGAALVANALVEISGIDGKAYPVTTSDYAAVANCNYGTAQTSAATGRIIAQTSVIGVNSTDVGLNKPLAIAGDGSILALTLSTGAFGIQLNKYTASGAFVNALVLHAGGGTNPFYSRQIIQLSNGNFAVFGEYSLDSTIWFGIVDVNLNVIKAFSTFGEAVQSNQLLAPVALSGGGFAVLYQQSANGLLSRLTTYDNTGTVVLAPTTIWTRTGTSGYGYFRMAQLSSGNLAIAWDSANTVSNIGLFYGVVTTGGAIVQAFTSLDTVSAVALPELSVLPGYFAIGKVNATNAKAYVFSDAGVAQGAAFSAATTSNSQQRMANDGVNFWMMWMRTSDSAAALTKIPVTGTGYVTSTLSTSATLYGTATDIFIEGSSLVIVAPQSGANTNLLFVASLLTGALAGASTPFGTAASSSNSGAPKIVPGGDLSFVCLYGYVTTAGTFIAAGKYANTAILGVATGSASQGALVSISPSAGIYNTQAVRGSQTLPFDMTTGANIYGNRGSIVPNSAVLKGM